MRSRLSMLVVGWLGLAGWAGAQTPAWTARYNSGFVPANGCPGACEPTIGKRRIALDAAGNIYVTGYPSNASNNDYRTIKYAAADGTPP